MNCQPVSLGPDSDGTVTNVEIFTGTTRLGQGTNSTYSLVWSNVASGAYSLTAIATDNLGASTISGPVDITVISSTNIPPVLQLQYQLLITNGVRGLSIFPSLAQPYSLDASSNLTTWASIFTNQTGATASNFIQAPITSPARQFFRGRYWP